MTDCRNFKRCLSLGLAILTAFLLALSASHKAYSEEAICYLGSAMETGVNNGYSDSDVIGEKSPHFGWDLGSFYVSGFTSKQKDESGKYTFLKKNGDKLKLRFRLDQNIDALNGKEQLAISNDTDGFDEAMAVPRSENGFGRGTVIVRQINHENEKSDPLIYRDFLVGVEQGADTDVQLFEEGDYEVKFNYEIRNDVRNPFGLISIFPEYSNYSISFNFSVRNGNTMVFLFDSKTGSELVNEASTPNGFTIDMSKSRYLDVNVKREVLSSDGNSLVATDTRENGPARDGEKYEEPSIYTITASNPATGEKTTKVIYVGDDPVLRAFVVNDATLKEIKEKIEQGARVGEDGQLEWPVVSSVDESTSDEKPGSFPVVLIAIGASVLAVLVVAIRKAKKPSPIERGLPESEVDYEVVDDDEE